VKAEIKRLRAQLDLARAEAKELGSNQHIQSIEAQLHSMYEKEEIMYKQRSRQDWLHAGDKNTKYF
jgi:Tfp pilus assembly protein FimT